MKRADAAMFHRALQQIRAIEAPDATVTSEELARGVAAEWAAKAQLGGRAVADDRHRGQLGFRFERPRTRGPRTT